MIGSAGICFLVLALIVATVYRLRLLQVLRHYGGCILTMLVGGGLNMLVQAVNGGLMPVGTSGLPPSVEVGEGYVVLSEVTRLPFLADIIPTSPGGLASIGDLTMLVGTAYLFIAVAMVARRQGRRRNEDNYH